MKIRVNNIECRLSRTGRYEFVKWSVNEYYGNEEKMVNEDGFERLDFGLGAFALRKNGRTIHSSCFENPETCYVVAYLEYDKSEGCCDMTTVGPRLLELKKKDIKAFFKVYEIAEELIRLKNNGQI